MSNNFIICQTSLFPFPGADFVFQFSSPATTAMQIEFVLV